MEHRGRIKGVGMCRESIQTWQLDAIAGTSFQSDSTGEAAGGLGQGDTHTAPITNGSEKPLQQQRNFCICGNSFRESG